MNNSKTNQTNKSGEIAACVCARARVFYRKQPIIGALVYGTGRLGVKMTMVRPQSGGAVAAARSVAAQPPSSCKELCVVECERHRPVSTSRLKMAVSVFPGVRLLSIGDANGDIQRHSEQQPLRLEVKTTQDAALINLSNGELTFFRGAVAAAAPRMFGLSWLLMLRGANASTPNLVALATKKLTHRVANPP